MSRAYIDLLQWLLFNIYIVNVEYSAFLVKKCYCEECAGPNDSKVAFTCDLCLKKLRVYRFMR